MGGEEDIKLTLHDFLGAESEESFPPSGWAKRGEGRAADSEATPASALPGSSSGGQGLFSGNSDLGSRRKRGNSDSTFINDKIFPVGSEIIESSRLMKMFRKEVMGEAGERLRRSHDDDMLFAMQPPPRPTSLISHPPISSRPDSQVSKLDRSLSINPCTTVQYPSRFGQTGTYVDKLSSYSYKDANTGATIISQTAADEGSRTGIKSSRIMNVINPCSWVGEKNSTEALHCRDRSKAADSIELEPSRDKITSSSRQMTIFYAGQAHVFDDVQLHKADAIMALAGSNGGSWSTTYSPKSSAHVAISEAKLPARDNEMQINNLVFSRDQNHELSNQENWGPGLSQFVRIPDTGRPARDRRSLLPAAEPDDEGEGDV